LKAISTADLTVRKTTKIPVLSRDLKG
jgi:hypothetical protein